MKRNEKNDKNIPTNRNSYEELFIPKQRGYEELFEGGAIEELTDDTPYTFIHPNKYEIEELLEDDKKNK